MFTVLISRDHHHATLGGDIDMASAGELDAALAGLSGEVAVDCAEVTFIGSTGFYALDRGYEAARAKGGTFAVLGMSRFQRRVAAILSVPLSVPYVR